MAHLLTFRPTFVDLRSGINLTFGAYQIYINHWGALHLTDNTRAAATAVVMTSIEATPAHAAILRVSHGSQPITRCHVPRDYSSGPTPRRKRVTRVRGIA